MSENAKRGVEMSRNKNHKLAGHLGLNDSRLSTRGLLKKELKTICLA